MTHQHFKEILRVNGFIDLESTEQFGFLILNLTREDSEHIRLSESEGKLLSRFDHEKKVEGKVVLEGRELSLVDADDDEDSMEIPGGTRRLTVRTERIRGVIITKHSRAQNAQKVGSVVAHYLISVMDLVERMRSHKTTANPVISIWLSNKETRLGNSGRKKLKTAK